MRRRWRTSSARRLVTRRSAHKPLCTDLHTASYALIQSDPENCGPSRLARGVCGPVSASSLTFTRYRFLFCFARVPVTGRTRRAAANERAALYSLRVLEPQKQARGPRASRARGTHCTAVRHLGWSQSRRVVLASRSKADSPRCLGLGIAGRLSAPPSLTDTCPCPASV